jgi:outer membrane protein assembly factor BamB
MKRTIALLAALVLALGPWPLAPAFAGDWPQYRGPEQNGVSREKDLPDRWSPTADAPDSNLIWKAPYGGRSTPIVMNGRVYLINDAGEGINEQERVMCFNADTGEKIWEYRFNVFHTDIVSDRVGWTNVAGDPETGYVYAHGVQGLLFCFDRDGKVIWSHSLTEEYGRISGYGGRVNSPMIDGDLLIVGMVNASWGEFARGGNRFLALDKRTGVPVWWSETENQPRGTYYSCPVVAVINGERLLITGSSDGGVHAFKVRTGEKVWGYLFSAGAINGDAVVDGTRVYSGHGQENLDTNVQGRVICVDAAKVKDGKPALVWERKGIKAKFASPVIHEGRLYVCDDTAKMYCLDANTGKTLWTTTYGRIGMGSPVWADGKLYVGAVNSYFRILKPGPKSCEILHSQFFPNKGGVDVEISGSPAVANGRIYFMTTQDLYCIGKKNHTAAAETVPPQPEESAATPTPSRPALLQVVPADLVLHPGESAQFKARLFDEHGRFLRDAQAEWKVGPMLPPPPVPGAGPSKGAAGPAPPALQGEIGPDGSLTVSKTPPGQFGAVLASADGLTGRARVRVAPALPYRQDFEKVPTGRTPAGWVNCQGKFLVQEKDGSKVLAKVATNAHPLVARANAYIGMPDLTNYTIEADVMGTQKRKDLPDMGVVANRYTLMLAGNAEQLRLVSWDAIPRVDKSIKYTMKPNVWYRMKLSVEVLDDKAIARGKVWPRDQTEPADWTVEFTDPTPNRAGSPALYGYATGILENEPGTEIYYDNVIISPNKK